MVGAHILPKIVIILPHPPAAVSPMSLIAHIRDRNIGLLDHANLWITIEGIVTDGECCIRVRRAIESGIHVLIFYEDRSPAKRRYVSTET